MLSVHLKDLKFHAFHGVYEGESKVGTQYLVNLEVSYPEQKRNLSDLNDVINYVDLFTLVRTRMKHPSPLLEEAAEGIIRKIIHQYPFAKEITISIFKLHPPIENFEGAVGVTLKKKFDDS